jgi:hypothetical protein
MCLQREERDESPSRVRRAFAVLEKAAERKMKQAAVQRFALIGMNGDSVPKPLPTLKAEEQGATARPAPQTSDEPLAFGQPLMAVLAPSARRSEWSAVSRDLSGPHAALPERL